MRGIYISREDSYYLILNVSSADKTNDKRNVRCNEKDRQTDRKTDRQREREKEMIKISGGLKKPANKSTDIIKRGY